MKGKLYLASNGFNTYDIFEADQTFIFKIADILVDKFGFNGTAGPFIGLGGCYLEVYKNHIRITVGWDNWSGCFSMAYCEQGNNYIKELGNYLDYYLDTK